VRAIDDNEFGVGKTTTALAEAYERLVRSER
jgi:hypothetical protein